MTISKYNTVHDKCKLSRIVFHNYCNAWVQVDSNANHKIETLDNLPSKTYRYKFKIYTEHFLMLIVRFIKLSAFLSFRHGIISKYLQIIHKKSMTLKQFELNPQLF